jgi:hypothetical protein
MFKKIFLIAAAALTLAGCTDHKGEEKTLLADVLKYHDKVMADDGIIMKNKMQLKGLAASSTTPGVKDSVVRYSKQLDNADDAMMTWMNKFNPDFTGKPHNEIMAYLNTQKKLIAQIDSQLNRAITASNKYITQIKTK